MTSPIRLVLTLHNHQPIGNFDGVMEQAYQDSYLPFLEVFEPYESLKIAIHNSGSLIEWLDRAHPEYLDRLAALVAAGRLEIVGGAFYEPILTMIPPRDRVGQIASFTEWLNNRLGADVQGMWMPERVWEQSLTSDLATAGIRYTILDDFHFKCAGWTEDDLHGYYLTENNGQLLSVFPGSEKLRYTLPFAEPQETIDYLRHVASIQPNAIVMFGDDGEKFGTWPDTKAHVYDNGWLRRFLDALVENQDWINVTTPTEALNSVAPLGKIYIPEASYREMTEWALPAQQQNNYEDAHHELEDAGMWDKVKPFIRGGFWRNFKARYPETGEMYARMLEVSNRLAELRADGQQSSLLDQAQTELYRGQCNCSYWHGAFGGVYLPHLRNAVFNHLIAADNLIDEHLAHGGMGHADQSGDWASIEAADYNFDARQEVRLASNALVAYAAPAVGGSLYELDVRSICHNLLATLARRPEAYHRKVLAGPSAAGGDVASIHDRVVFKQEGLDKEVSVYDTYLRKSLVDHFFDLDVSLSDIATNEYREQGDFVTGSYEAKLRRSPERMQLMMTRDGHVDGHQVRITKGITLEAGGSELEIAYLLEGLPKDQPLHFGIELNFAGLPSGADDRYFHSGDGQSIGQLGVKLDQIDVESLHLVDGWLGIDCGLTIDRPTSIWTHPIATVSQSEGGVEMVHQSVVVLPHWMLQADESGRWSVKLRMTVDTSLAESRMNQTAMAVGQ
jgi:hypothetical protein